jgi:hypothetical protein
MSLIDHALGGKLIRIRDGHDLQISGSVNSNELIAAIDSDLRYGDVVRDTNGEDFVVQSCQRNRSPSGNLAFLSAKVVPYHEWTTTQKERESRMTVTQHIASANAVAGRDISGDITINVTPEKLAEKLEALIMSLPLPDAEKKSIWSKIASAIGNLSAAAAKAFVTGLLK